MILLTLKGRPSSVRGSSVNPTRYAETHKYVYELTCFRKSSRNEKTGKRMLYMAYEVRRKLSNGMTIAVTLKPYGNRNKRMLEEMYNQKVAF